MTATWSSLSHTYIDKFVHGECTCLKVTMGHCWVLLYQEEEAERVASTTLTMREEAERVASTTLTMREMVSPE